MVKKQATDVLAPHPVHPTAVRHHGLFGIPYVRQHVIVDDQWTPNSLTEEFQGMGNLLARRGIFKKLESKATRKNLSHMNRNLRRQCRDGRAKLQMILYGDNTKDIRNFLINHKDMQRLYQKMPVYQVVDNINQRTFVMRKERDRLSFRLNQMKEVYKNKLLDRSIVENRIKYENEFVLDEENKSRAFLNKISKSAVRLNAVKTINSAYRKMLQVLKHDAIFYEPILRSLVKDTDDQANFIKHILYLGMPGIAKFTELSEEYRKLEDAAKKSQVGKMYSMATYMTPAAPRTSAPKPKTEQETPVIDADKRYVRETHSMQFLKGELEAIENTIKQVKYATLCSQAKEIFPRIKTQVENNEHLRKLIENDILCHDNIEVKLKRAEVLEGVLIHSLSEEDMARAARIKELKEQIKQADDTEAAEIEHMKNCADTYVVLRKGLWNFYDILRHVDKPLNRSRFEYSNSYLKLPLLKFEMLLMQSYAPGVFEENLDEVMRVVTKKTQKLMKAYNSSSSLMKEDMDHYINEYQKNYLDSIDREDVAGGVEQDVEVEDLLQEHKTALNVPNRKQIKAISAKIVEELSKKED